MILRLHLIALYILLFITTTVRSAFLRSAVCDSAPNMNVSLFEFTTFIANASYDEDTANLQVQLTGFSLDEIIDVNATTNMFTTVHVILKYVDETVIEEYYRLCDIVKVDHNTNYHFPKNVYSLPGRSSFYDPTSIPSDSSSSTTSTTSSSSTLHSSLATSEVLVIHTERQSEDNTIVSSSQTLSHHSFISPGLSTKTSSSSFSKKTTSTSTKGAKKAQATEDSLIPVGITKKRKLKRDSIDISDLNNYNTEYHKNGESCPIYANNEVTINLPFLCEKRSMFGAYHLQVSIVAPDAEHVPLSCTETWIALKQPRSAYIGINVSLFIAILMVFVNSILNYIFSPYQDSDDLFLFSASRICNAPLLNQLSPDFTELVQYLHYIFFMAALNLNYPNFFQPLIADLRWTALLVIDNNKQTIMDNNVYQTAFAGGLRFLTNADVFQDAPTQTWRTVLINLSVYLAAVIGVLNLFYFLAILSKKNAKHPSLKRYIKCSSLASIGMVLNSFMKTMSIPLLVTSLYLLTNLNNDPYGGPSGRTVYHTWSVATTSIFLIAFFFLHIFFICKFVLSITGRQKLYKSFNVILIWINSYEMFKPSKVWFLIIDIIEIFLFSVAIGCIQNNGTAQLILIIVIQGLYLFALLTFKPYYSETRMNRNRVYLSSSKLITSFLHLPFLFSFHLTETVKTRFTWVILIMHSLVILLLFILPTIRNMYLLYKSTKKSPEYGENRVALPFQDIYNLQSIRSSLALNTNVTDDNTPDQPVSDIHSFAHKESTIDMNFNDSSITDVEVKSNMDSIDKSPAIFQNGFPVPPKIRHHSSMAFSLVSNELSLTDKRVLPTVSFGQLHASNISLPNTRQATPEMKKEKDWTTREADYFFNASRILEPDPEVRRLWEEREKRLDMANTAKKVTGYEKESASYVSDISEEGGEHLNSSLLFSRFKKVTGYFNRSREPKDNHTFEVVRPRRNIVYKDPNNVSGTPTRMSSIHDRSKSSSSGDQLHDSSESSRSYENSVKEKVHVTKKPTNSSLSTIDDYNSFESSYLHVRPLRVVNNVEGDFEPSDDDASSMGRNRIIKSQTYSTSSLNFESASNGSSYFTLDDDE